MTSLILERNKKHYMRACEVMKTYSLPWMLRAYLILQNIVVHKIFAYNDQIDITNIESTCTRQMTRVLLLTCVVEHLITCPSLFVSVQDREKTLKFQSMYKCIC